MAERLHGMDANTVEVGELREVMERILTAVERVHGSSIPLGEDYYWHLPVEDAYAMNTTPKIREAGQISDDLVEIRQSLSDDDAVLSIWHDLAHTIGVLRAVEHLDRGLTR